MNTNNVATESVADRIGISTNLYLNEEDSVGLIRRLAGEFKYVEVELEGEIRKQTNEVTDFSLAKEIRKISEDTGAIINIHAPYIRIDYLFGDNKNEAREVLLRSVQFAVTAGSRTLTFHPGFRYPIGASNEVRAKALETIQEVVYDMLHETKHLSADLEFCLENSGNERPFLTLTHEENDALFSTAPLALTLDIAHAVSYTQTQDEAMEELKRFGKYAKNVHLSDVKFPKHRHLPLGDGDFDVSRAIRSIESTGYAGPYIVEEIGGGYAGDQYFDAAVAYRERLRNGELSVAAEPAIA